MVWQATPGVRMAETMRAHATPICSLDVLVIDR